MANKDYPNTCPVYVTKWALTTGVMKFDTGTIHENEGRDQVYFSAKWGLCNRVFVGKQDWTYSLEEAKARVRLLVKRRVESLKRQARKLEDFEAKLIEPQKET